MSKSPQKSNDKLRSAAEDRWAAIISTRDAFWRSGQEDPALSASTEEKENDESLTINDASVLNEGASNEVTAIQENEAFFVNLASFLVVFVAVSLLSKMNVFPKKTPENQEKTSQRKSWFTGFKRNLQSWFGF